jgi:hypothetical protein
MSGRAETEHKGGDAEMSTGTRVARGREAIIATCRTWGEYFGTGPGIIRAIGPPRPARRGRLHRPH